MEPCFDSFSWFTLLRLSPGHRWCHLHLKTTILHIASVLKILSDCSLFCCCYCFYICHKSIKSLLTKAVLNRHGFWHQEKNEADNQKDPKESSDHTSDEGSIAGTFICRQVWRSLGRMISTDHITCAVCNLHNVSWFHHRHAGQQSSLLDHLTDDKRPACRCQSRRFLWGSKSPAVHHPSLHNAHTEPEVTEAEEKARSWRDYLYCTR